MDAAYMHDPFPTPFKDEVMDNLGGMKSYSFTNGFLGYHQVRIAKEYHKKTTFAIEWGSFSYNVLTFKLKNEPIVFSKIVVAIFKEFMHKFMKVYLDD